MPAPARRRDAIFHSLGHGPPTPPGGSLKNDYDDG